MDTIFKVPQSYSDQYHHLFQQMSADAGDQLARAPVAVWDQRKKVLGMISALDEGVMSFGFSLLNLKIVLAIDCIESVKS